MTSPVAAVDLGATSGRLFVGTVSAQGVALQQVGRFPNTPVTLPSGVHWDVGGLWTGLVAGLRAAGEAAPGLASVGIDTWGADYGLLRAGRLLGLPYHYRDLRTVAATAVVDDVMSPAELYRRNGLDPLPFNSLYQLVADREEGLLAAADAVLFMPDLLGYWLTGRPATEPTIASTSGLLAPGGIGWDTALVRTLGLPVDVLPPMLTPGDPLGPLTPSAAAQTGLDLGVVVRKVASHDTASAVVGTPLEESGSAYLSCGTWSLLGVEVDRPVIGEEARLGRFTHEAGVDGTILLHKNLMGLGLVSGLVGDAGDLVAVLRAAASVHLRPDQLIDPADPAFLRLERTADVMHRWFRERGIPAPEGVPALVRCVLESLAEAFARGVADLERLGGRAVPVIHLVGGGAQNSLLCQATADRTGRPVVAGPVEASVVGNVLVQARAQGGLDADLAGLRELVRRSASLTRYDPR